MTRRKITELVEITEGLTVAACGWVDGLPAVSWGNAPRELLDTVRGLRRRGLRPGGSDPVAVLVFGHRSYGRTVERASLYLVARCVPKRVAAPGQMDAARRALRTCTECGHVGEHYVPKLSRMCVGCEDATGFYAAYAAEHGYSWEVAA